MSCNSCTTKTTTLADYASPNALTWCPGCGNFGIQVALKQALVASGVTPHQAMLCFDIGCNGNGSDKIDGYRFHGLHGRILPLAAGIACANRELTIVAEAGDGATFGEGVNHLINAVRANFNMTLICHNNENYGLTKGQASATTRKEVPMNSSPDGVTSDPLHPQRLVLSLGASFSARVFSGDIMGMKRVFEAAIKHQGFSFIEVLQNCPTYNKATPHEWYQQRVFDVATKEHDATNRAAALQISEDVDEHVATGILFQDPNSVPFMQRDVVRRQIETELIDEVKPYDISAFTAPMR